VSGRSGDNAAWRRRIEDVLHAWIGWSFPPVERAFESTDWAPDAPDAYCARCGGSVGPAEASASGCAGCRSQPAIADRVVRLGAHAGVLRRWILAAKYERWREMGAALGRRLGETVLEAKAVEVDRAIVVPVPMPWQRRLYRGIDHARVLADGVGRTLGDDVHPILAKVNGPPQVSRVASERRRGRRDWMYVRRRIGGWPLNDLHVVLVDDVKTTGATLRTASRLLRELGAARVVAAVASVADESGRRRPQAAVAADSEAGASVEPSPNRVRTKGGPRGGVRPGSESLHNS